MEFSTPGKAVACFPDSWQLCELTSKEKCAQPGLMLHMLWHAVIMSVTEPSMRAGRVIAGVKVTPISMQWNCFGMNTSSECLVKWWPVR